MKPDGVATAAMEPMEALDSNPGNEAAPAVGQEPNQAASPAEEETPQQHIGDTVQVEPQPEQAKETPAAKTDNKSSGDSKAKTPNKATAKTKPSSTTQTKTTTGSRPNTSQSRVSNGTSKPQTNGVAKKAAPAPDKKSTLTAAPAKRPTSTAGAPPPKSKVGEKKSPGAATTTASSAKPLPGPTAAKKTPSSSAAGVKTSATAAAAKKPIGPKSAPPSKPATAAAPKPDKAAVSKTTRPTTTTPASSRPATGVTRQPLASATKSSPAASKPPTPKTPSSAAKPAAAKPNSSAPSAGKAPTSQTSRNSTPVKKDVTKPATPLKKAADSPLTRTPITTKPAKSETPKSASKSDTTTKKPATTTPKSVDTKTPSRPKPQESKPTPYKTPISKTAAKTPTPKKTVGSSTPTPVKRGPKATTVAKPEMEIAAAVAAAAAIATAAAAIAVPEEPEPLAEVAVELTATTPEAVQEKISEPIVKQTPEPVREPTPEPIREPTPEPIREPTPEPAREPTPEPIREETPEPLYEPTPVPVKQPSPEPLVEPLSQLSLEEELGDDSFHDQASSVPVSAQMDLFKFQESVPSLGTTVMSPPCSPPGPVSPVREPQNASSGLDMHFQSDPWAKNQHLASSDFASESTVGMMNFQTEERENKERFTHETREEEEEEEEEEDDEEKIMFMPPSTAPSAEAFNMMAQPPLLVASPLDDFTPRDLTSPHEKEEAVEKADEEINEDDDEEEEDEDEEQRRLGHQPLSFTTDMSTSQPSEEFQVRSSAFGGSAGWHGDDLLSGMDSEDVSSCTSSRQQGVSDLSSTQHTAILEGTQSSDAMIDSSLRGSEGDGNLMGSPNVETLANEEEEEDEDEEDERVDDMDLSSERIEERHKVFQQQEHDEEDDEDVEMHSEGVTESCGNVDEDDFNEEEHLDNLNRSVPPPCKPPAASWGQTNPFADTWGQPASLLSVSSPSPVSDHGAAESETPTQSPAQTCFDGGAPSFVPQAEPQQLQSAHEELKGSEEAQDLLAGPAMGMSKSGTGLSAHGSSETSTPEELRDYDSSSGVESRSDKQHTPVPASVQPDMEQDLGIHLEKGDGEEEEAETLPADEVLGTGPPTAPASAPSSPSTSGDEASDTEGEMQINDPDAPMMMDESAGFESPTPTCNLPALDEDEEAAAAGDGEEDGGGATPQSAHSVASYGFDCTTSNSNAHSMAESCGKSPGIFSLENEEQLPEEAKDPSLIKELTLPSAAAAAYADDLLGRPVDLMPLGLPGGMAPSLDEHHYMLGGKVAADHLGEVDPMGSSRHFGAQESGDTDDSQPPYYSTICDKTDSFLAGNV
ncbi:cell surface glycoprotein 1 isoform X3 [Hippoglossus hippoglossus]|uniref:cell surface glycoprotein 1 isoform X2 n=1 Tax=Hippoglossus hippoglossus TaxID=8267 RepID=UPI00148C868E|nr:cell surface glycoprotein 1 isoform X2 [Hippoglossus hippoglossus]XP_034448483.1 cell surface glycoprotein 1 isoform X3 [Hippoglossus hippoglossus]